MQLLGVLVCAAVCLLMGVEMARFKAPSRVASAPDSSDNEVLLDESPSEETPAAEPAFRRERIRGRVVWLAAALKEVFGISTVPEVAANALALQTPDGQLLPLVENLRGRAFRADPRLREMDLELLVRRHRQQPYLQVLRVYEIDDGQRFEVDYWCDVCAIVMFETGPCACCQEENRLRRRPVDDASSD